MVGWWVSRDFTIVLPYYLISGTYWGAFPHNDNPNRFQHVLDFLKVVDSLKLLHFRNLPVVLRRPHRRGQWHVQVRVRPGRSERFYRGIASLGVRKKHTGQL